jgi:hypothetical protein
MPAIKSQELGLTNIEYAQADILELGALGRTFDLIEAQASCTIWPIPTLPGERFYLSCVRRLYDGRLV